MTLTGKDIEQLKVLAERATPGPCERDSENVYSRENREHRREHFLMAGDGKRMLDANNSEVATIGQDIEGIIEDVQARYDLDYLAALRNAVDAGLLDLALRGIKLQAELDAADKAIVALIAEQRATDVAQSEATGSMSEHAAAIDAARKADAERWGK